MWTVQSHNPLQVETRPIFCIHCGFFNVFSRSLYRTFYVRYLMYSSHITLATLWISCAFPRRGVVSSPGVSVGASSQYHSRTSFGPCVQSYIYSRCTLCVSYIFHERPKRCIILHLVTEVLKCFKRSSYKSMEVHNKRLSWTFLWSERRKISLKDMEAQQLSGFCKRSLPFLRKFEIVL